MRWAAVDCLLQATSLPGQWANAVEICASKGRLFNAWAARERPCPLAGGQIRRNRQTSVAAGDYLVDRQPLMAPSRPRGHLKQMVTCE